MFLSALPLPIDALLEACAIREEDTDLDQENSPSLSKCLEACLGLVTVDQGTSTLRLVHFTLQEYLEGQKAFLGRTIEAGHDDIARTCITCLMFKSVTAEVPPALLTSDAGYTHGVPQKKDEFSINEYLLEYAAWRWGDHVRQTGSHHPSCQELALKYLKLPFRNRQRGHRELCSNVYGWLVPKGMHSASLEIFTPLHIMAYFGTGPLLAAFLRSTDTKAHSFIDGKDALGRSPLHWAARQGHLEVARVLIAEGARVNAADVDKSTLPHLTACWVHEAATKLLLANGAEANSRDKTRSWTALYCAAAREHEVVLRTLEDTTVRDLKDLYIDTPLHLAAQNGDEAMVNLLVTEGALVDVQNRDFATPLHCAVEQGHRAVTRTLLAEGGADVNKEDFFSNTPLHWAVRARDEVTARMLVLDAGAMVDAVSFDKSQTPLHVAVESSNRAIATMLISEGRAAVDKKDYKGRTPLHMAAERGMEAIVRSLIARGATVDIEDDDGNTPLRLAARAADVSMSRLLIATGAKVDSETETLLQEPRMVKFGP